MAEVYKIIPFSKENRLILGGRVEYDTAVGNRVGQMTANALRNLIAQTISRDESGSLINLKGSFDNVMDRFERRLRERIEAGQNVTDFNLVVCPYIPGEGRSQLAFPEPQQETQS